MAWALGSTAGKRLDLPAGAMRTATQMLCGGALMAAASVLLGEQLPAAPPVRTLGALVYLAIFGSLAGFSAYSYLLHNTRTVVATSYAYVNPVIAVALGVAFAGEKMDGAGAFGAATILAAVLLITRGKASPRLPAPPPLPAVNRARATP
jgi:drug/metabolite transporter (DMT)-like permease